MTPLFRLIGLFILIQHLSMAQRPARPALPVCASPDLTNDQRQSLSKQAESALRTRRTAGAALAGIKYVPIRPHIFRRTNGTGGMSLGKLNNVIAIANSYYLTNGSGIQFYLCGTTPDYVDNDSLFNGFSASNESAVTGRDAKNALNQYYVNAFNPDGLGGYAYFPNNSITSTRSFILNESDESDLGNRLIPHELGHNFGLFHTFGNAGTGTTELVTRGAGANCSTDGDLLCDTPADPYNIPGATTTYLNGCQTYTGTATDEQGNAYAPSVTNLMSYYFACTHDFTPGQYDRIQAGLALRQTHTAYSLTYPPTAVVAPSNLAASLVGGNVVLTWRDNATDEMGYFIERSTSASSGYVPIGGVGPGGQTFTDSKTAGLTTYFYRIRPSNTTTGSLSQTVSIRTGSCRPTYGPTTCSEGDGLASLTLSGTALSQTTDCSPDGYRTSSLSSVSLTAGQSYSLAGSFLNDTYREGVTIWADLNRNGIFETDRNERLFRTPATLTKAFSGTLTLPASATAGPLVLRIVVAYDTVPADPCGTYEYGETEDYQLNVVSPPPPPPTVQPMADLSLSMQVSNRTPAANGPVSYSVTVQNNGPADATGVGWENRLPASMTFVSGDTGLVSSGTAVGVTNLSIASGASLTFVYRLKPGRAGTYRNAVQIVGSNQTDPDSKPASGTDDGQDDTAMVEIRTRPDSNLVFRSPNPNQTPLPTVIANQPRPDATKADLSLSMNVNNRTPRLGKPVTFTITISNGGGLTADNVVVRDTLRGLSLLASPTNVSVVASGRDYSIIEGTVASLPAGGSTQLIFTATPTIGGYLTNTAQIWSVNEPDPDSTPGSSAPGNTASLPNGEDDTVRIDLRVGS